MLFKETLEAAKRVEEEISNTPAIGNEKDDYLLLLKAAVAYEAYILLGEIESAVSLEEKVKEKAKNSAFKKSQPIRLMGDLLKFIEDDRRKEKADRIRKAQSNLKNLEKELQNLFGKDKEFFQEQLELLDSHTQRIIIHMERPQIFLIPPDEVDYNTIYESRIRLVTPLATPSKVNRITFDPSENTESIFPPALTFPLPKVVPPGVYEGVIYLRTVSDEPTTVGNLHMWYEVKPGEILETVSDEPTVEIVVPKPEIRIEFEDADKLGELYVGKRLETKLSVTNEGAGPAEELLIRFSPEHLDVEDKRFYVSKIDPGETYTFPVSILSYTSGEHPIEARIEYQDLTKKKVEEQRTISTATSKRAVMILETPQEEYFNDEEIPILLTVRAEGGDLTLNDLKLTCGKRLKAVNEGRAQTIGSIIVPETKLTKDEETKLSWRFLPEELGRHAITAKAKIGDFEVSSNTLELEVKKHLPKIEARIKPPDQVYSHFVQKLTLILNNRGKAPAKNVTVQLDTPEGIKILDEIHPVDLIEPQKQKQQKIKFISKTAGKNTISGTIRYQDEDGTEYKEQIPKTQLDILENLEIELATDYTTYEEGEEIEVRMRVAAPATKTLKLKEYKIETTKNLEILEKPELPQQIERLYESFNIIKLKAKKHGPATIGPVLAQTISDGPIVPAQSNKIEIQIEVHKPRFKFEIKAPEQVPANQPFDIQVTITNTGKAEAKEVILQATLPPELEIRKGVIRKMYPSIKPTEQQQLEITVAAKTKGEITLQDIQVTYQDPLGEKNTAKPNPTKITAT